MARTFTTGHTVYKFSELSEKAQEKALESESQAQAELFDGDCVLEDFGAICTILGVELRTKLVNLYGGGTRPVIYWSGFSSQGDGACFEGWYRYAKGSRQAIREYAQLDTELHRIADELYKLQQTHFFGVQANMTHSGHYYHSGCMVVDVSHEWDGTHELKSLPEDDVTELMRDLANWLYRRLSNEYDWATGEECCREWLEDSEREFYEDGTLP